jgi:HAMP domain-containing protein
METRMTQTFSQASLDLILLEAVPEAHLEAIAKSAAQALGSSSASVLKALSKPTGSKIAHLTDANQAEEFLGVFLTLGVRLELIDNSPKEAWPDANLETFAPFNADAQPMSDLTSEVENLPNTPEVSEVRAEKRRTGLGRRILLGSLVPLAVTGLIVSGYLYWTLPNIFNRALEDRALTAAISAASGMKDYIAFALDDPNDMKSINDQVREQARQTPGAAFVAVTKGLVVSLEDRTQAEPVQLRKDLNGLLPPFLPNRGASGAGTVMVQGVAYTIGTTTIGSSGNGGRVFVALRRDQIQADLNRTLLPTLGVLLLAMVGAGLLSGGIAATIVRPIVQLTNRANRISMGDLEGEDIRAGRDEIGDLNEAVERMRVSLKLMMGRMKRPRAG